MWRRNLPINGETGTCCPSNSPKACRIGPISLALTPNLCASSTQIKSWVEHGSKRMKALWSLTLPHVYKSWNELGTSLS